MSKVVLKVGDDVSTDIIYPGRFMATVLPSETPQFAFQDLTEFNAKVRKNEFAPGSFIVAGKNFGCGSSREQAAIAIREAGVVAVIAPTFARIFFRNAINVGLPLIEADLPCSEGGIVRFILAQGFVEITGKRHKVRNLSPRMQKILNAGGLVEYWRRRR